MIDKIILNNSLFAGRVAVLLNQIFWHSQLVERLIDEIDLNDFLIGHHFAGGVGALVGAVGQHFASHFAN